MNLGQNVLFKFVLVFNYNISKLQYPVNPESSLYIMSALEHQKNIPYPTGRQRNQAYRCSMRLVFNKRSGAAVMSPDSEGYCDLGCFDDSLIA